ncbi:MAG: H-type lectin domain-containing protein [Sphingomonadaceae bacterium]
MNFGASYKFLSASFGSSSASVDEVASRYCSASDNYSAKANAYDSYVETIAPGAFDAYKSCVEGNKHIVFKPLAVLADDFKMAVTFQEPGNKVAVLRAAVSKGLSCTWNGKAVEAITIPSPNTATLSCRRDKTDVKSSVVIARENGPESVGLPWQAYTKEGVPVDLIAQLRQELATANSQIEAANRELKKIQFENGVIAIAASPGSRPLNDQTQCPTNAGANRGLIQHRVNFAQKFNQIPVVSLSISHIDVYNDRPIRLAATIAAIDQSGFNINFNTWCDTWIAGATASWVALAR